MLSEEQFAAAVAQKRADSGNTITLEEAETLVNKQLGRLSPKAVQVIQPPAPTQNSLTKKVDEVLANRLEQLLFPTPKDGAEGRGPLQDVAKTIQLAAERGANSLQLLDGTVLHFGPQDKGDSFGEIASKRALQWGQEKLERILEGGVGGAGGTLDVNSVAGMSPELLKVLLDNDARTAELNATINMQKDRNATLKSWADLAGALFRPGGLEVAKGFINMMRNPNPNGTEGPPPEGFPVDEAPSPSQEIDKFPPVECANCKHIQRISRGMPEYVCDACGQTNNDIEYP